MLPVQAIGLDRDRVVPRDVTLGLIVKKDVVDQGDSSRLRQMPWTKGRFISH